MMGYCHLCGRYARLDKHHVFGGAFRNASERYKMYVYICRDCHDRIHFSKDSRKMMDSLRWEFQQRFEENHTREEFMALFHRNYGP